MSDKRNSTRGGQFAAAVFTMGAVMLGVVALSAAYVVQTEAPLQSPGTSVHAKNSATPEWMLDLSRDANQSPVTVQNDKPSFWI